MKAIKLKDVGNIKGIGEKNAAKFKKRYQDEGLVFDLEKTEECNEVVEVDYLPDGENMVDVVVADALDENMNKLCKENFAGFIGLKPKDRLNALLTWDKANTRDDVVVMGGIVAFLFATQKGYKFLSLLTDKEKTKKKKVEKLLQKGKNGYYIIKNLKLEV